MAFELRDVIMLNGLVICLLLVDIIIHVFVLVLTIDVRFQ
jgi:hypothetical protein